MREEYIVAHMAQENVEQSGLGRRVCQLGRLDLLVVGLITKATRFGGTGLVTHPCPLNANLHNEDYKGAEQRTDDAPKNGRCGQRGGVQGHAVTLQRLAAGQGTITGTSECELIDDVVASLFHGHPAFNVR